jgi:hypothetical protein
MTASFRSHPVITSSRPPRSGLLAAALGTALMVAAPIAMGFTAMESGREGRPMALQATLSDSPTPSVMEHSRSSAAGDQHGEFSPFVVSPRSFAAPFSLLW